ncbi:hypothetical protein L873DRAFT_1492893 [Choiromyces venosus 120613-1]|uniref:Uncharacterized protein n=1 Tax=Choiromyces venosus 120613-1 TaxID=1336337 RepID=A0A3N4JA34_9PEZI|nr:hypothetical protein L873DRAFT_1492893 [Choiromyces venosus 120613-1]
MVNGYREGLLLNDFIVNELAHTSVLLYSIVIFKCTKLVFHVYDIKMTIGL